jgi:hypothetical protein
MPDPIAPQRQKFSGSIAPTPPLTLRRRLLTLDAPVANPLTNAREEQE